MCWGGDGFDANIALCPAGLICVKPYRGSYFRRLLEEYGKTASREGLQLGRRMTSRRTLAALEASVQPICDANSPLPTRNECDGQRKRMKNVCPERTDLKTICS